MRDGLALSSVYQRWDKFNSDSEPLTCSNQSNLKRFESDREWFTFPPAGHLPPWHASIVNYKALRKNRKKNFEGVQKNFRKKNFWTPSKFFCRRRKNQAIWVQNLSGIRLTVPKLEPIEIWVLKNVSNHVTAAGDQTGRARVMKFWLIILRGGIKVTPTSKKFCAYHGAR